MAALTAASWTLTIAERVVRGVKKITRGTLALPGTDTYPTGGVPLPAKEQFGFIRQMDSLVLMGQAAAITSYVEKWDKANHKLMLYVSHDTAGVTTLPMDEEDSAGVPGARTWDFVAEGW
jgi:hypothetical protein